MTEVNEKFRQHVTSVAFNLTLKRTMIEAMTYVRHMQQMHAVPGYTWNPGSSSGPRAPSLYVTGFWACERRGLLEQLDTTGEDGKYDFTKLSARLTPAGELVWQLLLLSGLVFDIVETKKDIAA